MTIQQDCRRQALNSIQEGLSDRHYRIIDLIINHHNGKATALELEDELSINYRDVRPRLHELASYEYCREHYHTEPKLIAVGTQTMTKGKPHKAHTIYGLNIQNEQGVLF